MDKLLSKDINIAIVVFLVTLGLRIAGIGLAPYTDEGIYAAYSFFMYSNYTEGLLASDSLLPATGTLLLYPLITSPLYFLPFEPLFMLRLFDGAVAAFLSVVVYFYFLHIGKHRASALLATLVFIFAMAASIFVDGGYKNSIQPAMLFLFLALLMVEKSTPNSALLAGVFAASFVLFREAFFFHLIIISLYILYARDFRFFICYVIGGVLTGIVVIGTLSIMRGGVEGFYSIVEGYTSSVATDPATQTRALGRFHRVWPQYAERMAFLFPLVFVGLLTPLLVKKFKVRRYLPIYLMGLAFALAPLYEILVKNGFAYHYSQIVIGLVILLYFGLLGITQYLDNSTGGTKKAGLVFVLGLSMITVYLSREHAAGYPETWKTSRNYWPVMVRGDWDSTVTKDSFYLRNALAIKRSTSPQDRIMVGGHYSVIFPLARRLPMSVEKADLSVYLMRNRGSLARAEVASLVENPPDALIVTGRRLAYDNVYRDVVKLMSHNYSAVERVPRGLPNYGGYSSAILTK